MLRATIKDLALRVVTCPLSLSSFAFVVGTEDIRATGPKSRLLSTVYGLLSTVHSYCLLPTA